MTSLILSIGRTIALWLMVLRLVLASSPYNVTIVESNLDGPQDVFVDFNGSIFIASSALGIIKIVDGNRTIVGQNPINWGFSPYRICGDRFGMIYVSSGLPNPTSYSLTSDGSIFAQQNHNILNVEIRDMAVDPLTDALYLITSTDSIYRTNSHLDAFARVASHWTFGQLFSMCFHPITGMLYISDEWGPFVYSVDVVTGVVIHLAGIYNNQPGNTPALSTQLGFHASIAVDKWGMIFFGSMVSHNVLMFDKDGNVFYLYDALEMNANLAVDNDGVLYVPEYYKGDLVAVSYPVYDEIPTLKPSGSPSTRSYYGTPWPISSPITFPPAAFNPEDNMVRDWLFMYGLKILLWCCICGGGCLCQICFRRRGSRCCCVGQESSNQVAPSRRSRNTRFNLAGRREVAPSSVEMVTYAEVQQFDDVLMESGDVEYVEVEAFPV